MAVFTEVDTHIGTLNGRDYIFLDEILFGDRGNSLTLRGELNGDLCSKGQLASTSVRIRLFAISTFAIQVAN